MLLATQWLTDGLDWEFERSTLVANGDRFRFSEQVRDPGIRFPGSCRKCRWYVLDGSCRISISAGTQELRLRSGEVAVVEGEYEFEVLGDEPNRSILAWNISELERARAAFGR